MLDRAILALIVFIAALALIALMAPDLIAFSSFLVIPFLILYPAPSIFIYATAFGIAWFTIGRRNRFIGALVGLAAMAAIGIGVPQWINSAIDRENARYAEPDLRPAASTNPAPLLVIVEPTDDPTSDILEGNNCRFLCRALLYSGSVEAVVMADPATPKHARPSPRVWRLVQRNRPCSNPRSAREYLTGWTGPPELDPIIEARSVTGECLMGEPVNLPTTALTLEHRWIGEGLRHDRKHRWALIPPLQGERVTLTRRSAAGQVRVEARWGSFTPRRLEVPLRVTIAGSPNSGAYWEWRRQLPQSEGRQPDLSTWLSLKISDIAGPSPSRLRMAIDEWLKHPERGPEPTDHVLQDHYFRMIEKSGESAEDLPRVEAILGDQRTDQINFIWMILGKFPMSSERLLGVIIDRIAALPPDDPRNSAFAGSLSSFPSSAFAKINPTLVNLLQDDDRRPRLEAAILRLGDAGPAAAPILFKIVDEDVSENPDRFERTTLAAISALCKIGPEIAPAYGRLEHSLARNPVARDRLTHSYGSWFWAVARIRLGRPLATIENPVPKDTVISRWEERLQRDVTEGNCDIR